MTSSDWLLSSPPLSSFCAFSSLSFLTSVPVPERAMVPMLSITCCRVMPRPVSVMRMVFCSLSTVISMAGSWQSSALRSSGRVSDKNRSVSMASEEFEISSRRKISFLL